MSSYPIIATIQGQPIERIATNIARFRGDLDVDCDGSGPNAFTDANGKVWKDRFYTPDTTLHFRGKALNAHAVPYVVVPPAVVMGLPGIVLGCLAVVTNTKNGRTEMGVVGDLGPTSKVGEVSVELARRLGVDPNPVIGGDSDFAFIYEIRAGIPAYIDGITYELQRYR